MDNYCEPIKHFLEITKIPRKSADEKAIFNYIKKFAENLGLEYKTDDMLNIMVYKAGSPGHENDEPLMLQAHIDMVYEVDPGAAHKYEEPLDLIIDGDLLTANGTTLGADDGTGIAMMLSLMENDSITHPPYEFLFTTQEEDGLLGALEVPAEWIHSTRLINLDGECEEEVTAGCAGGFRSDFTVKVNMKDAPAGWNAYRIRLEGLAGGHSGLDIGKGLGNANKIMAELLDILDTECGAVIADLEGGSKMNVIPAFAEAVVCVPPDAEGIEAFLSDYGSSLKTAFEETDPNLVLRTEKTDCPAKIFDADTQNRVLTAILLTPNGVLHRDVTGERVLSSNNLGRVEMTDKGLNLICNPRSSITSHQKRMRATLKRLASVCDAELEMSTGYPAWEYLPHSKLREMYVEEFEKAYGKEPLITVLHAGLECGIIVEKKPGIDAISVGPEIHDVHSTKETTWLSSIERNWNLVRTVIEKL